MYYLYLGFRFRYDRFGGLDIGEHILVNFFVNNRRITELLPRLVIMSGLDFEWRLCFCLILALVFQGSTLDHHGYLVYNLLQSLEILNKTHFKVKKNSYFRADRMFGTQHCHRLFYRLFVVKLLIEPIKRLFLWEVAQLNLLTFARVGFRSMSAYLRGFVIHDQRCHFNKQINI